MLQPEKSSHQLPVLLFQGSYAEKVGESRICILVG